MSAELKPCPFCGSCDIKLVGHRNAGRGWRAGETVYSIDCMGCTASFANRYKREILVEQWNRRAQPAEKVQPVKWQGRCNNSPWIDLSESDAEYVKDRLGWETRALYTRPPAAEADRLDAERYRFMLSTDADGRSVKDSEHREKIYAVWRLLESEIIDKAELDAAIDAALAASKAQS